MIKDTHYVVDYFVIDDFRCFRPLSEAADSPEHCDFLQEFNLTSTTEEQLREELRELFLDYGWEGDGEINCMFLPPCFLGTEDGYCEIIYHVKQKNNGVSWLAIPNGTQLGLPTGCYPSSIMKGGYKHEPRPGGSYIIYPDGRTEELNSSGSKIIYHDGRIEYKELPWTL